MRHFAFAFMGLLCAFGPPATALAEPPPEATLPEEDARPGPTRAQAIEAYTKDCHATLTRTAWVEGEETQAPLCTALDVEQNCNPDIFGCDSEFNTCQLGCQPGCSGCQTTCAGTCDGCKAACKAGDRACITRCATARADCGDTCLEALTHCQGPRCLELSRQCFVSSAREFKKCDRQLCGDYGECVYEQNDYEKATAICGKKVPALDPSCQSICGSFGLMAFEMIAEGASAEPEPPVVERGLAEKCTSDAKCPDDYAKVAPFLGSFCSGALSDASLKALAEEVRKGAISKRSLSLIFNAYGAMHGYTFKKETWMNDFFYGSGVWLPASCRAKMKTVASAKKMPFRLTKLRDQVKRIWNEAP